MTFEEIRQAVVGRMLAFTGIPQARIEYPNQPKRFEPPATGTWIKLNTQFGTTFFAGMADRPHDRKPGLITLQCFDKAQAGTKALSELATALEAHFAYWSEGQLECWEASQVIVGTTTGTLYYQINVNIRFVAG